MPVGFKNSTDGNLQVALDGMHAAETPHSFLGIDDEGRAAIIQTTGDPEWHFALGGGGGRTNSDVASVERAVEMRCAAGEAPRWMVDCSHGNSNKDFSRQPIVLRDLIAQRRAGSQAVMGTMIESHLHAGNQPLGASAANLAYGVSITDACIDWETTELLLREAAETLRSLGRTADKTHQTP